MIDLKAMIPLMGRSLRDPALVDAFTSIGIDLNSELRLPEDQYQAHIERSHEGLCFIFTDEAMFLGKGKQLIGQGPPYFTGVFAFSEGREGYSQYQGELPFGLTFSHGRRELAALLGEPSWQTTLDDGTTAHERWDDKAEFRIAVTYYQPSGKPAVFCLFRPDTPLPG